MLSKFLATGWLDHKLANHMGSYINICYLNSTRKEIKKICSDAFCKGKSHQVTDFIYNGAKEIYKFCSGTPVICIDNMKDCSMYNS